MTVLYANLMRPTKATGSLGEPQGLPEIVCPNIPFRSMENVSGFESESARQTGASATYQVEIWGDPSWKDLEGCWFEILPLTDLPRKLNIAFVKDRKNNGEDLLITCGE